MIIYKFIKKIAISFTLLFHKVNYHNIEKIPQNHGCILCCNHRSNWDPFLIAKPMNKKIYFMAKEELFKHSLLSFIIKKLGAFPVARGKRDISAISHAIDLINSNNFVVIFPEGTRAKTSEFLKPKSGAAMVAHKSKADILPIRVIYQEPLKFRSQVDVIYGDIIHNNELNIAENSLSDIKVASQLIMEKIKNLHV